MPPALIDDGEADVNRWLKSPPCAPPRAKADKARIASAVILAAVENPTTLAPRAAPRILVAAANAIAAAAIVLAAATCVVGSTPAVRSAYSPNTMAIPPRALARISTSSDHPKRNAIGRPHPS